jgi:hypothetical protein
VTPFPHAIAARWIPGHDQKAPPELVHILATSEEEYLAVNMDGQTIVALHGEFRLLGSTSGGYSPIPEEGS